MTSSSSSLLGFSVVLYIQKHDAASLRCWLQRSVSFVSQLLSGLPCLLPHPACCVLWLTANARLLLPKLVVLAASVVLATLDKSLFIQTTGIIASERTWQCSVRTGLVEEPVTIACAARSMRCQLCCSCNETEIEVSCMFYQRRCDPSQ